MDSIASSKVVPFPMILKEEFYPTESVPAKND